VVTHLLRFREVSGPKLREAVRVIDALDDDEAGADGPRLQEEPDLRQLVKALARAFRC
jgi:hypothetical protein